MSKSFYKGLSLVVFSLGIIVLVDANAGITGAVIGGGTGSFAYLASLIFMFIAAILFVHGHIGEELEQIVSPEIFGRRIATTEPDEEKRRIILDASAIISYGMDGMKKILSHYHDVIVPQKVLEQIKNPQLRTYVGEHSRSIEIDDTYRQEAETYLAGVPKAIVIEILNGERQPPQSRTERSQYMQITRKLMERLNGKELTRDNLVKEAERNFPVDPADVEVLATALYLKKQGRHPIIGEKDVDFECAVEKLKGTEYEGVDCVGVYAANVHTL